MDSSNSGWPTTAIISGTGRDDRLIDNLNQANRYSFVCVNKMCMRLRMRCMRWCIILYALDQLRAVA